MLIVGCPGVISLKRLVELQITEKNAMLGRGKNLIPATGVSGDLLALVRQSIPDAIVGPEASGFFFRGISRAVNPIRKLGRGNLY